MYTQAEIKGLVAEKIAISKSRTYESSDKKIPEYSLIYKRAVELAEKIAVHATYDKFPDNLFKAKAPNQDPKEFEYMKGIYPKPSITMPYWYKALGILNRIWNDANWAIQWAEDVAIYSDATAQRYFEKEYPVFGSYENYHKEIFLPKKINDPNAVAAYKPAFSPVISSIDKKGKTTYQPDDSIMISPIEVIYNSDQVISYQAGKHLLVELYEKSLLDNNKKEGRIFEFYDEQYIWRIEQIGKKEQYTFRESIYYHHGLGYLPCQKLKGRPTYIDSEILYLSYFLPAVSLLDEAIRNFSTKQMSVYANAFSVQWEYFDQCDYKGCAGGKILNDKNNYITCPQCNGSGNKNKHSPTGVYQLKSPTRLQEGDAQIPTPPLGFVAPGTEILNFLKDEIRSQIQDAFTILNIDISNSTVKGGDTALGKQIDREEMFSFLLQISNEIFSAYEFGISTMGLMRYGFDSAGNPYFATPKISYPRTFAIRSEQDLTVEITTAKAGGLPDIAIRELLEQWLSVRFNSQEEVSTIVDLVFKVDRLVTKSDVDINAGIVIGKIAKWEAILHDSIYTFIDELIVSDSEFLMKDFAAKKTALIDLAKAKAAEISPIKTAESIIAEIE